MTSWLLHITRPRCNCMLFTHRVEVAGWLSISKSIWILHHPPTPPSTPMRPLSNSFIRQLPPALLLAESTPSTRERGFFWGVDEQRVEGKTEEGARKLEKLPALEPATGARQRGAAAKLFCSQWSVEGCFAGRFGALGNPCRRAAAWLHDDATPSFPAIHHRTVGSFQGKSTKFARVLLINDWRKFVGWMPRNRSVYVHKLRRLLGAVYKLRRLLLSHLSPPTPS